jgi:hypothetical protein
MSEQVVIGLFDGIGTAEDVRNRLKGEGVAESDIQLRVLKKVEPIPPSMAPETHEFAIDILFGSTFDKYRTLIRNGETAVCVWTRSEDEAEAAVDTMRQYAPIEIDRVSPEEKTALLRRKADAPDEPPR